MSSFNETGSRLIEHLSSTSTPYGDPLVRVPWDRLNRRAHWMPDAGVSLHGWAEFMNLPEDQRRMLSRYEFLSLLVNVHSFESLFMERTSRALRDVTVASTSLKYRLHMVREHAGHGLVLMELARGAGMQRLLRPQAGWLTRMLGHRAHIDGLLFWVVMYIREELSNRVFRWLRKQQASACPVIDELTRTHLVDASRHLSHAHEMLENLLNGVPTWKLRLLQSVVQRVFNETVTSLFYPHKGVYEAAGLYPGEYWVRIARNNPHRERFVQYLVGSTLRPFKKRGMLIRSSARTAQTPPSP